MDIKQVVKHLKSEKQWDSVVTLTKKKLSATDLTKSERVYFTYQLILAHEKLNDWEEIVSILNRYFSSSSIISKNEEKIFKKYEKALLKTGAVNVSPMGDIVDSETGSPVESLKSSVSVAAIIDTETTGLLYQDDVVEFAIALFSYNKLNGELIEVLDSYSGLRQPAVKIPRVATRIHGIRNKDVRGKELDYQKMRDILSRTSILIAHNARFDYRFSTKILPAAMISSKSWYCSMNGVNWSSYGCSKKSLSHIGKTFGVSSEQSHRALDDVNTLLDVLTKQTVGESKTCLYYLLTGQPIDVYSIKWPEPPIKKSEGEIGCCLGFLIIFIGVGLSVLFALIRL